MFDFIRNHTRVLFFFLIVLIIPSFVFFGLQGYTNMDRDQAQVVASVGDIEITQGRTGRRAPAADRAHPAAVAGHRHPHARYARACGRKRSMA